MIERRLRGEECREGTILLDAPGHDSVEGLVGMAQDRQLWNGMCNALCPKTGTNTNLDTNADYETAALYKEKMERELCFYG